MDANVRANLSHGGGRSAANSRQIFDGEIKAPPSVGVHVVDWIDVFATALDEGVLALFRKNA